MPGRLWSKRQRARLSLRKSWAAPTSTHACLALPIISPRTTVMRWRSRAASLVLSTARLSRRRRIVTRRVQLHVAVIAKWVQLHVAVVRCATAATAATAATRPIRRNRPTRSPTARLREPSDTVGGTRTARFQPCVVNSRMVPRIESRLCTRRGVGGRGSGRRYNGAQHRCQIANRGERGRFVSPHGLRAARAASRSMRHHP